MILLFALVQPLFAAGQSACIGDTNADDIIGVDDVLSVLAEYGGEYGGDPLISDTNADDIIDIHDVLSVLAVYGASADGSGGGRACIHKGNYQCSELKPLFHENQCSCPFESDTKCTAIRSAFDGCGCADSQPQFASGDSVSGLPKFTTKRNCKDIELKMEQLNTGGQGTTYRLSLDLGTDMANVYAIYGTADHPMSFPASYQEAAPFGVNIGGAHNSFFAIKSGAQYDSWLTVGQTEPSFANTGTLSSIGIGWDDWTSSNKLLVEDGAVFYMSPDDGPATGSGGSGVVVAQVTVTGSFIGTLNAQGRSNNGDDWYCEGLTYSLR